jgi:kinetochore protein Spc25
VGQDKLLFRISNIDPTDDTREGSFVLDVAGSYKGARSSLLGPRRHLIPVKVLTVSPNLPAVAVLSSQLADSGDINWFIKEVRRVFAEHCVTR